MQTTTLPKAERTGSDSPVTTLTLIDGSFTPDEAREILLKTFSDKLNFHKIKNWSSLERFGKEDEIALKRIPELTKEVEKLQELLSEAKNHNKRLVVTSEIRITLAD